LVEGRGVYWSFVRCKQATANPVYSKRLSTAAVRGVTSASAGTVEGGGDSTRP